MEALAYIGPLGGERSIEALQSLAASKLLLTSRGTSENNPYAVKRREEIYARTAAALAIVKGHKPVHRLPLERL